MSTSSKQRRTTKAKKRPGAGRGTSPLKNNGVSSEAVLHREALDLFRSVVNESNDAIFIVDPETSGVLYANAQAASNLGYSQAELASLRVTDFGVHAATMDDWRSYMDRIRRDGYAFFGTEHRRKDGSRLPVEVNARIIRHDDREYFISIVRDLSGRKKADQEVRTSEERLRLALTAASQGLYDLNVQTGDAVVSPEYARMLGYEPEEFRETNAAWRDRLHPDDRAPVYRVYEEYIAGKRSEYRVEFRQRTKAGAWKWILSLGKVVEQDVDGRPLRMLGTHTDISDRKETEERIRHLNRVYAVMSNINQAIVRTRDQKQLFDEVCRIAVEDGKFRMAWIGMANRAAGRVDVVAHAGKAGRYLETINIALDGSPRSNGPTGTSIREGRHMICNDIECDERMAPWRDQAIDLGFRSSAAFPLIVGGEVRGSFNIYSDETGFFDSQEAELLDELAQDISFALEFMEREAQRVRAQEELERNRRKLAEVNNMLRLVLDTIPARIFWKDTESNYLGCNRLFAQDAGRTAPEELIGRTDYDMGWREQADLYRRDDQEVMTTGAVKLNYEEPQTTPEGDRIWLRTSKIPLRDIDGAVIGVLGTYEDITEAKVAEERLREAVREARQERSKTDAVIAAIGHAISIQDRDYRVLYQNEIHKGVMGDQLGNYCYQMYEHRDAVCEGCPIAQTYQDGGIHTVERSMERDGVSRYFEITASPLRDADGAIIAGIEVAREVTDRKQREAEQQKLLAIIENNSDFIALAAPDGRVLYVNPAGRRMVGLDTPEQVQQTRIVDYHLSADQDEHEHVIMPKFRESGYWRGDYRFRHFKTGQAVPVEVNAFIIRDAAGAPFALAMIARDISERMELEAQFLQAQKMESVGRLAGGIAHDFNNILTAIIGYSELLLMQLPEANPMRHNVVSIRESADRAAALTNQLLAFSRQQVLEMQVVDLNGVIEGMAAMLRRMIGEDVRLELRLARQLRHISADPVQIGQVLMNLAVNARDAMPGGGTLTIATEDVALDGQEASVQELASGVYALLSVADTGHGMSQEVLAKIFDPFFTTKELGKGTGLGLATAYGIVKQHGGHIAVESTIGTGSVFRIYLPAVTGEAAARPAPKRLNMPRGSETVLVAEDEPALLELITSILGSLGYRVLRAPNGEEALKIATAETKPIDVLLTDVIMPGINGRILADLIAGRHPETKVMFMSGYTEDYIAHHGVLEEGRVLVHKPLKPQDLAQKLREVLGRS